MVEQKYASVDEYVATFPPAVQEVLEAVRRTVHDALPGVGETISYHMPLFTLDGRGLFFVAGWKRHISLYPVPELDDATAADAAPYLSGASTLKLPLASPVPLDLVRRVALLHAGATDGGG
jgi:uncharacterized protein YdhG (YjbR/CyaY superfamily)